MLVRYAGEADAEQAASVLRPSIATLCSLDHGGAEDAIARWIGNKTADNVRRWIASPDGCVVVAEEHGVIVGVDAASFAGEITLNCVAPEARFAGVSKAILAFLEARLREQGQTRCMVTSTRTARAFYLACGYSDFSGPDVDGGQRLIKLLHTASAG